MFHHPGTLAVNELKKKHLKSFNGTSSIVQVHECRRRVTTKWIPSQADWLTGISSHFEKKLLSKIEKKINKILTASWHPAVCAGDWMSVRVWELTGTSLALKDRLSGGHDGGKSRAWRRDQHDETQSQRSLIVLCKYLIVCLGTKQYLVQTGFVVPWIGTKLSVKLWAEWRNITILQKAATTMSTV